MGHITQPDGAAPLVSQAPNARAGPWRRLLADACRPAHLALWGIVLVASVLRLARLDLIEFKADEASHLLRGLEIVEQHRLPLTGSLASVGIPKPPLMTLLMAVPLLLGRDPRLAAAFIALLNVLAVAGCYLLARRYYGARVAVIAATLFAVNPWAVVLSRKVFTADVLAPFLVLYLYGLHAAVVDRAAWGWLAAAIALGLMLNITFSPLPLALVLLLAVVACRRRVNWRHLFAGAALAGLLLVPYLYAGRGYLRQVGSLLARASEEGPAVGLNAYALQFAADLHSGAHLGALAGASAASFAPAPSPLGHLEQLAGLLFAVSLLGVAALGLRAWSRREGPSGAGPALLAAWLLVPLASASLLGPRLEMHYLVILYPAGFLAMGLACDRALAWLEARPAWAGRLGRVLTWAGLAAIIAWQAYAVSYLYAFVARHDTSGGYGVPLRHWLSIAGMVRREAALAGVDEVWVVTEGSDISYEQSPIILHYLLGPDLSAIFQGQGGNEALVLPAGRVGLYLLTRPVAPALNAMLGRLGGGERASLPNPDGRTTSRVVAVPARPLAEVRALVPRQAEWTLDAGLVLLGYEWPADARAGATVSLATCWTFADVPPAERNVGHSLFNHILDSTGGKVAQRDGFGLHERHWRDGLVLVQWFDLQLPPDLPAGDYTWLTGMYRLSDYSRNRVFDQEGREAGDAITLGPVHIEAAR